MKRCKRMVWGCLFWWPLLVLGQVEVGQWRTHASYSVLESVEESADKVFACGKGSLFSYDPATAESYEYTKLTGLSGSNVSLVRYYPEQKLMVVVYADSNMDLITAQGIQNLPDISLKQLVGSKQINDLFFVDDRAYLSAECGLIVLNLSKCEVAEYYDLGMPVKSCVVTSEYVYAFTSTRVLRGKRTDNLLDKSNWAVQSNLAATRAVLYGDALVAFVEGKGLYRLDSGSTEWRALNNRKESKGHKAYPNRLVEYTSEAVYVYGSLDQAPAEVCLSGLTDVSYRNDDRTLWCTTSAKGLCGYRIGSSGEAEPLVEMVAPQGPASNTAFAGLYDRETTYFITSGPMFVNPRGNKAQVMQLSDDNRWYNLSQSEVSKAVGFNFVDVLSLAVSPSDPTTYFVSTWYYGLLQFKENTFVKNYHARNSGLEGIYSPDGYCWVNGLSFDRAGNLWMLNSGVEKVVKVLKADSTWSSLHFASIAKTESMDRLMILRHTASEYKWVIARRTNKGILVFDDRGTIDTPSDDQSRFFGSFTDQDGKTVSSTTFNCQMEDRNGTVWVGTNRGPLLFHSPSKVFDADFYCTRVKVPRNDGTNLADYLLDNEDISCMAVDGANRKWLGTSSNGIYLLSDDGLTTIHHFTTKNSPLPADNILSVTVHPHSGEVFIGTESGVVSYRSDATEPEEDFSQVKAFPNPVRPDYTGPIVVTGLEENSQVKIVNSGGQLVFKGQSYGGQITWDGQDGTGRRVRSGVYLVFCSAVDGGDKAATKILVIN